MFYCFCFFFKQKTADVMRISDWSLDVCSADLLDLFDARAERQQRPEKPAGDAPRHSPTVEFLRAFELLPIPIIASVHGVCLGGGFELALACDYIIAAQSAKIGSVEATLGLHPLMGGVQRQVPRSEEHTSELQSIMRHS